MIRQGFSPLNRSHRAFHEAGAHLSFSSSFLVSNTSYIYVALELTLGRLEDIMPFMMHSILTTTNSTIKFYSNACP